SGRIQTRSYEAKDGTKRYITEVIAEEVKFLEWGDKATTDSSYNNRSESSYQSGQNFGNGNSFDDDIIPVDDGDIPF
ncbi:single-stranded DNA-binding protein, partial [Clostridium botulinum]|nr:single-stranded DNA-binding protein [Clostridium botulinum]